MFVIPKTKQMASRMLDLPLPFKPVIELKLSSLCDITTLEIVMRCRKTPVFTYHPEMTVRDW